MDVFSSESKQQVLNRLFHLATEEDSVPAIKLYLELAGGITPADTLTLEHALELLRQSAAEQPQAEPKQTKTKRPKAAK